MADPKETLSLNKLADHMALRNQTFREEVAAKVLSLFRVSVIVTVALTALLAASDAVMIWCNVIEPGERLISGNVVLALIGASVVELGAALGTIVVALFRAPKDLQVSEDDGSTDETAEPS